MKKLGRFALLIPVLIGFLAGFFFPTVAPKPYKIAAGTVVSQFVAHDMGKIYDREGLDGVRANCLRAISRMGSHFACWAYHEEEHGPDGVFVRDKVIISIYANEADARSVERVNLYLDQHVPKNMNVDYIPALWSPEYKALEANMAHPLHDRDVVLSQTRIR